MPGDVLDRLGVPRVRRVSIVPADGLAADPVQRRLVPADFLLY